MNRIPHCEHTLLYQLFHQWTCGWFLAFLLTQCCCYKHSFAYPMTHQQVFLLGIEYIYLWMWMLVENSIMFNFASCFPKQVELSISNQECMKILGALHLWFTASTNFVVIPANIRGVEFYPTTVTNKRRIYVHFLVFSPVNIYFFHFLLAVQRRGWEKDQERRALFPA